MALSNMVNDKTVHFFEALSNRERARKRVDVQRLVKEIQSKGHAFSLEECEALLKSLETESLGKLVKLKHNRKAFDFNTNIVKLGQQALRMAKSPPVKGEIVRVGATANKQDTPTTTTVIDNVILIRRGDVECEVKNLKQAAEVIELLEKLKK